MISFFGAGSFAHPGTASARWCRIHAHSAYVLVHVVLLVGLARKYRQHGIGAVIVCWLVIQKVL